MYFCLSAPPHGLTPVLAAVRAHVLPGVESAAVLASSAPEAVLRVPVPSHDASARAGSSVFGEQTGWCAVLLLARRLHRHSASDVCGVERAGWLSISPAAFALPDSFPARVVGLSAGKSDV
jgi:hypothetical protein